MEGSILSQWLFLYGTAIAYVALGLVGLRLSSRGGGRRARGDAGRPDRSPRQSSS